MRNPHGHSRLINWLGVLAWMCFVVVPSSVLLIRVGMDVSYGLPAFALGCLLALIITIILTAVSFRRRYQDHRGAIIRNGLPAVPPALLLVGVMLVGLGYPPIHDITTNTDDPPLFDAAEALRGRKANPVDIKPEAIAIQREHYTNLHTIHTSLGQEAAFQKANDVAESLEWLVYNSDPRKGIMEASYTSFWFGFVDDVVIRVRPGQQGTEIDLRSVSRVGKSDLGANAKRIRIFAETFEQ